MTDPKLGANSESSNGCDAEPENPREDLGNAATTARDLEEAGKDKVIVLSSTGDTTEELRINKSPNATPTLDPVCGMSVDEMSAFHVERDGKMFYFCSDQCLKSLLATIAGVKSDSKAASCCG